MTASKRNTDPFAPLPVKKVNVKQKVYNDSLAIPQLEQNYREEMADDYDWEEDEIYRDAIEGWGDRD